MKKPIKKWGDSLVIVFTKEECLLYKLKEGLIVDLSDMILKQEKKK